MRFDIITIFPEMFPSVFAGGVIGKAVQRGRLDLRVHNLRDFTTDKHQQVDDRPFGGEEGMVFKPEPVFAAVEAVRGSEDPPVYLLSPAGRRFDDRLAREIALQPRVVLICGRYEGVDERVALHLATDEISIGDYVVTGGELPAMIIVDAVARHPSQIYQAAGEGLLLFTILWVYSAWPRAIGKVSALFLIGYGALRFSAEYFRNPDPGIFSGLPFDLSTAQWLCVPMILVGLWLFFRR